MEIWGAFDDEIKIIKDYKESEEDLIPLSDLIKELNIDGK